MNLAAFQNPLALLGRALIALLFIPGGLNKISGFSGTVGYIASKGVPLPEVCAAIAIVVELGLGLARLLGWQTRWSALIIAGFTVVITFIFHAFWAVPAEQARTLLARETQVDAHLAAALAAIDRRHLMFIQQLAPGMVDPDHQLGHQFVQRRAATAGGDADACQVGGHIRFEAEIEIRPLLRHPSPATGLLQPAGKLP